MFNKGTLIIFVIIGILLSISSVLSLLVRRDLIENGIVVNGEIVKINRGRTASAKFYLAYFRFQIDEGKIYSGSKHFDYLSKYDGELLIRKSFPVIYLPSNPKKHRMLIEEKDFEDFKLKFPDSLHFYNEQLKFR